MAADGQLARWQVVSDRSAVKIEATSSIHPIHGEGKGLTGAIEAAVSDGRVDAAGASGRVELPMQSLASGNPLYDRELRRRVDVRRYPTAAVALAGVEGEGEDGSLRLSLELTFHGVTRPFEERVSVELLDERTMVVEGDHTFDIRDYGIQPPRILTLKVNPEVAVHARIVAERPA